MFPLITSFVGFSKLRFKDEVRLIIRGSQVKFDNLKKLYFGSFLTPYVTLWLGNLEIKCISQSWLKGKWQIKVEHFFGIAFGTFFHKIYFLWARIQFLKLKRDKQKYHNF